MEDNKNLVNNDQLQIEEPPQYPGPQYPGPQYPGPQYAGPQHLGSTNTMIMAQPVPHLPQIIRSPEDLNVISSIKTKAILSLVLSIVFSLCLSSLFCTIPAIIFAILALTGIDTNIKTAVSHANVAAILTGVAFASAMILILIAVIYNSNHGYYYDY
ncbi:uncharacterized protein [Apostichopus japonicus]|uniref:uncharacterized protein isoform X1 n=1 Tax=Stichopus japonicus TaxID=307972 RepID=UPI003AB7FF98